MPQSVFPPYLAQTGQSELSWIWPERLSPYKAELTCQGPKRTEAYQRNVVRGALFWVAQYFAVCGWVLCTCEYFRTQLYHVHWEGRRKNISYRRLLLEVSDRDLSEIFSFRTWYLHVLDKFLAIYLGFFHPAHMRQKSIWQKITFTDDCFFIFTIRSVSAAARSGNLGQKATDSYLPHFLM